MTEQTCNNCIVGQGACNNYYTKYRTVTQATNGGTACTEENNSHQTRFRFIFDPFLGRHIGAGHESW